MLERSFFQEDDKVTDIMAWGVETIDADEDLSPAAQIMLDNTYRSASRHGGVLAEILTEADFVKAMAHVRAVRRR